MSDTKTLSAKERLANLKRGYKMCHEFAPTFILRECTASTSRTLLGYFGAYLSGTIVSMITGERDFKSAMTVAVLFAAFSLIFRAAQVFISVSKYEQLNQGFFQKAKILIAKKCADMDYIRIENPETHRMKQEAETYLYGNGSRWNGLGRLLYDTQIVFEGALSAAIGFGMCFRAFFLTPAVSEGAAGFFQSVWATLLMFAVYAALIAAIVNVTKYSGKLWQSFYKNNDYKQSQRALSYYMDLLTSRYQRGKDIRIYNQAEMLSAEWEKHNNCTLRFCKYMIKKMRFVDISHPGVMLLIDAMTYAFIIFRAASGMYTASEAVVLVMSITYMLNGIMTVLNYKVDFFDLVPMNLQRVFDFLDIPDEKYKGTLPTEKRDDCEYEFEFRHVWFKYPGSEEYVLRDVCLKWRIGEKMALVGRNGSGKSTLIKLLCRLYDPTEGEILLNGIDIRKYNYEEYTALFSVVFQDSRLFSFSIAENVAADTEYDPARVEDCVRRAGLSERLDEMSEGIETYLYKDFDENGVDISGGEAQKLCLARAVYKGSPFIVLDEPTAALDPISEHEVYTSFNAIVGTRTAIYISHRLSSCRFCDDITVLENGCIAERGGHEKLLAKEGVYAEMWAAQAKYYKDTAGKLFL